MTGISLRFLILITDYGANEKRVGRKGWVWEAKERPPPWISYLSRLVFAYPRKL
jgi:hypothetical protein